jgi:hypothetical protein
MKPSASQLNRIIRTRHIKWQKKGREYNIHFPFEHSKGSPGSTDKIGGISAFLRQEQWKLAQELNEWEEEYTDGENRYNNEEERLSDIEVTLKNIRKMHEEQSKEKPAQDAEEAGKKPHRVKLATETRGPVVIIQAFLRGCRIRDKVSRALSYQQLKRRATLRRFSRHRGEVLAAKARNKQIYNAATAMQSLFRGFKARQHCRKKSYQHYSTFALKIQCLTRQFLAKMERSCRMQAVHWGTFVARLRKVVCVQSWYRQHVCRRYVQYLRVQRDNRIMHRKMSHTLAVLWNGHIVSTALFHAVRIIKKRVEENKEKFVGFIPFQAIYRGVVQRRRYRQMLEDIENEKIARQVAAVKIQARWRVRYGKIAIALKRWQRKQEASRRVWVDKAYPVEFEKSRKAIDQAKRNDPQFHSTDRMLEIDKDHFYNWSSSEEDEEDEQGSPRYW